MGLQGLQIQLLGKLAITYNGEDITARFRTERERALLVFLAMEEQRDHRRDVLAEMLWPERPQGAARTNLRQALSGIRKQLPIENNDPAWLISHDEWVQFQSLGRMNLDVNQFRELVQQVIRHRALTGTTEGVCPECIQRLISASALYQGDFLRDSFLGESVNYQEWMMVQREQLNRQMTGLLTWMTQYYQKQGDTESALIYARWQVNLAPLEEEAHRQVMHLLYISGRRAAAIEQYHNLEHLLHTELNVAPSADTQQLMRLIGESTQTFRKLPLTVPLAGSESTAELKAPADAIADFGKLQTNLPARLTSFVGRNHELAWLERRIGLTTCRMVSIIGMPGSGKTRLAIEAGCQVKNRFRDGTWFVGLDGVESWPAVCQTILHSMGEDLIADQSVQQQVGNLLRDRQTLLILDNFEHLVTYTPELMTLMESSPDLNLLITSQQRLEVQSICELELKGLAIPPDSEQDIETLRKFGSVDLFIARAGRYLSDEEIGIHLEKICAITRLTWGLPLALELAAGNLRRMSIAELAVELEQHLDTLRTNFQDLPDRQRSLRAAFDQSWERLTPAERKLICRLAVFPASFTLGAARSIGQYDAAVFYDLVDKSLVQEVNRQRFSIFPMLRLYTAELLRQDAALYSDSRLAHTRYYLDMLASNTARLSQGSSIRQAMLEMNLERENLYHAWHAAIEFGAWDLLANAADAMRLYCETSGDLEFGQQAFDDLWLACPKLGDELLLSAEARAYRAWFWGRLGRIEPARGEINRALKQVDALLGSGESSRRLNRLHGFILISYGILHIMLGRPEQAITVLRKARQIAANARDTLQEAHANLRLAELELEDSQTSPEREPFVHSLTIFEALGDPRKALRALMNLGYVSLLRSDFDQAELDYKRARHYVLSADTGWAGPAIDQRLGWLALRKNELATAGQLLHSSLAAYQQRGDQTRVCSLICDLAEMEIHRNNLSQARQYIVQALTLAMEVHGAAQLMHALLIVARVHIYCQQFAPAAMILKTVHANPHTQRLHRQEAALLRKSVPVDTSELGVHYPHQMKYGTNMSALARQFFTQDGHDLENHSLEVRSVLKKLEDYFAVPGETLPLSL